MTGTIIAVILLVFVVAALLVWNGTTKDVDNRYLSGTLLMISSVLLFVAIQILCSKDTPQAIDVYHDKTTLEITYRDGMPIDSVVVFKNK
jgi:hypothetical protein